MLKIIGIGSPFGDDRLGWHVVESLKLVTNAAKNSVQLITADRPSLRLIELMQDANEVILIDAIKSQGDVGDLVILSVDDIIDSQVLLSSHDFGVQQSIQLAQALEQLPEKLSFYGVVIGDLSYHKNISSEVKVTIDKLINELAILIKNRIKCGKNEFK